jgi:sugar phosphate permease
VGVCVPLLECFVPIGSAPNHALGLTRQGLAHDPTSQIAGFINGVASLGSVLEGLLIGIIADVYGWNSVFLCITAMCFVSFFILFRAARTL